MRTKILGLLLVALVVAYGVSAQPSKPQAAAKPAGTPADGYTVHVSAPHMVDGKVMGPYHHYCRVLSPDPVIVCQIYESTDPGAPMVQVEYIIAKKLTRNGAVTLKDWNKYWHDHKTEIATGRVQVHDLPPAKAKEVADLVATTDGIIFDLWPHGAKFPDGSVRHPQAVGHVNLKSLKEGAE